MKRYMFLITAMVFMLLGFLGCDDGENPVLDGITIEGSGAVELTINITKPTATRSDFSVDVTTEIEELVFENIFLIITLLNEDGTDGAVLKDVAVSEYISSDMFYNGGTSEPAIINNVPAGIWDLKFKLVSREEGLDDEIIHSQIETITIVEDELTPVTLNFTLGEFNNDVTPDVSMTINLTNIPDGVTRIKMYSTIVSTKDLSGLEYPDISDNSTDWLVDYVKTGDNAVTADNYSITANMLPASEDPGTMNYVTIQAIHNNGIRDMVLFQGRGIITVVETNSSEVPYVLDILGFECAYTGTNVPVSGIEFSITTEDGSEYKAHTDDYGAEYANMVKIPYSTGDFFMDVTEVTISEFNYLMSLYYPEFMPRDEGDNSNKPIANMTIFDAMLFSNARSMYYGLEPVYSYDISPTSPRWEEGECTMLDYEELENRSGFRIPKKDEWVAALTDFEGFTDLEKFAHVNQGYGTVEDYLDVGSLLPNDFGIYDMLGNARELVYYGAGIPTGFCNAGWCMAANQADDIFIKLIPTAPYQGFTKETLNFYLYIDGTTYKEEYTGFRCVATALEGN